MRERRIAIFCDGSNFNKAVKASKYRVDYDKALTFFGSRGQIVSAKYFTALPPKNVFTPLRALTDRLSHHGWIVVDKDTKDLCSDDGIFTTKGNMDVEIAVSAMQLIDTITDFVLLSGDGDFASLILALQSRGIHCTVLSHFSHRSDCIVTDELRRIANEFLPLTAQHIRAALISERVPPTEAEIEERRRRFNEGNRDR